MTAHKRPIDQRPFRSKTEHLLEQNLEAQYRGVAIRELVAALAPRGVPDKAASGGDMSPAG